MKILTHYLFLAFFLIGGLLLLNGCQKDDYFKDSGVHDPQYKGTVMDFLDERSDLFDTLSQVIRLAGMEDVFAGETITFFAPADSSFKRSLDFLNDELYREGRDTVSKLTQISPEAWKEILSMYIFKGANFLNDYPQLNLEQIPAFPGQPFSSYGGRVMNIGVVYDNAGGVEFAGYRHLVLSYIPSLSAPLSGWINCNIATSDIQPTNGVIHALRYPDHFFGFSVEDFVQTVKEKGIDR